MPATWLVQRAGGAKFPFRIAILHDPPDGFAIALLRKQFPYVAQSRIKRIVDALRDEGRLRAEGSGRGVR